ncbi:hypothetical protein GALMADRAFT_63481 [Galerina marginata CBS 339.88]|uniref:T6SS Phospholipase effector Tle1-like catalytic domain-containing protein n=1 Tax=Galerina marginata (strain CBS 339.88) TaxID=685588 RepID=A0A067T904_GALM3|nr:hypothetical protein GALMADRAFT_63481 [Galerina marginata CBS 339.88]
MAVSAPANCKCPSGGRNLVICIDGTSNQFGDKNTNVVELYSKIEKTKDSNQLTYYNSGIGTYAKPSWKSVKYLLQVIDNSVDLAIAWNFEKIIIGAYRWLSDNYEEGDRIFLFGKPKLERRIFYCLRRSNILGFSRGAYQVRALAGMIARVGLIYKGNEEQIPFAYEVYATHTENFATNLATNFKSTFSRANVQVHFVGVWDTVSSVGVIRGKSLPLTDSAEHICFFRHALALDERRVKFLPEYVHGGVCEKSPEQPSKQASTFYFQVH